MTESYVTIAKNHYAGIIIPFFYQEESTIQTLVSDRMRIVLIQEGKGIIEINGSRFGIISPSVIFLNHHDRVEIIDGNQLRICTLYFHPDVLNSKFTLSNIFDSSADFSATAQQDLYILGPFLSDDNNRKMNLVDLTMGRKIELLMKKINHDLREQADPIWPCSARGYFIELLFLLHKVKNPCPSPALYADQIDDDIEKVILYLHSHYTEQIQIPYLLSHFHTNRTTLSEKFRKATNNSIISYITRLRLQTAASLLHNTDLDITQIMYKVGFTDMSYFGKIFRKTYQMPPSEYRKKFLSLLY